MLDFQDHCSEVESTTSPLDFPLHQPKDVLERIALHPFQDLESLLLDVSKPAVTTKNGIDQRSGKQVSRRPSLPTFPWSHAFGHSRTNSDAGKLSTSRSMCQGKWSRIGVIASSTDVDCSSFSNLDSFSYDQSLVPSSGSSDKRNFSSLFANLPFHQLDSSSSVPCSEISQAKAGNFFLGYLNLLLLISTFFLSSDSSLPLFQSIATRNFSKKVRLERTDFQNSQTSVHIQKDVLFSITTYHFL